MQAPTPILIKSLILLTALMSILSPIATYFFHLFQLPGPIEWFSLSLYGIGQGYLWQIFTYFFLQTGSTTITIYTLFSLSFLLFLLWWIGTQLYLKMGFVRFLLLYVGGGVIVGVASLFLLFLFSSSAHILGCTPALFALLTTWLRLYPSVDIYIFFLIRLKAKWLIVALLGISLLVSLAEKAFFTLGADLMGMLFGYLFGIILFPHRPKHSSDKIIDISDFH